MLPERRSRWGGPVDLSIAHNWSCTCEEGGPIEYGIVVMPTHVPREERGVVPVLVIYSEELEQLLALLARHLHPLNALRENKRRRSQRSNKNSGRITFTMERNGSCQSLGEYSLHVIGRGVDDILPVNRAELVDFVDQVSKLKQLGKKHVN